MNAIPLTYKHIYIWISVVEYRKPAHPCLPDNYSQCKMCARYLPPISRSFNIFNVKLCRSSVCAVRVGVAGGGRGGRGGGRNGANLNLKLLTPINATSMIIAGLFCTVFGAMQICSRRMNGCRCHIIKQISALGVSPKTDAKSRCLQRSERTVFPWAPVRPVSDYYTRKPTNWWVGRTLCRFFSLYHNFVS